MQRERSGGAHLDAILWTDMIPLVCYERVRRFLHEIGSKACPVKLFDQCPVRILFSGYTMDYSTSTSTANRYMYSRTLYTSFSSYAFAANTESESPYRRGDYTVWNFEDRRLADEVPEYRIMMEKEKKTRLEKQNEA